MIPTYIAYEYTKDKRAPLLRIRVRAWTKESALRKAQKYLGIPDAINVVLERI